MSITNIPSTRTMQAQLMQEMQQMKASAQVPVLSPMQIDAGETPMSTSAVSFILTVMLEESTQSSKQAKTNFGKNNTVDIGAPTIFGHTKDKLSGSIDANRDFSGSATSQQQNSLRGEITVSVHAVQPNGILEIRGEKWLNLNQGDEYIRLSGLVRADDIQNDNSVSSQRIADARISYAGRGALSDANAAGWLTRLFNHPLFPI
ncbi:flagellar basal body L-ring protein FlgH [Citrobacter amalonaticus]|uniref:flagellar basal body L-ring protein FlgH n=1 Tax=Citrobacter amalonaticus TaxID=35703 RepID=UPI002A36C617|nr:flagellar basal body L-ring protein FlgH [Citrobacter amalonaticus]